MAFSAFWQTADRVLQAASTLYRWVARNKINAAQIQFIKNTAILNQERVFLIQDLLSPDL